MPAQVVSLQKAERLLLEVAGETSGILLLDVAADRLHHRLRRDWVAFQPEEADVLSALEDDLETKQSEMGGRALVNYLLEHCSNMVRVSDPEEMVVGDFEARLNRLYRENVTPKVLPFRTHVPLTTLRAAAGHLSEGQRVESEEWIELPPRISVRDNMFVARVTGRSMEPRIPDGSYCLFHHPDAGSVAGSRTGRLLLIQRFGEVEETAQFTVKRYRSEKEAVEDGWKHTFIRLEPLNPEFEPWLLKPDEFAVLAEFVAVIPPEE